MTWIKIFLILLFSVLANLAVARLTFTRVNRVISGSERYESYIKNKRAVTDCHSYKDDKRRFGGNNKIMLYKSVTVEARV